MYAYIHILMFTFVYIHASYAPIASNTLTHTYSFTCAQRRKH